MIKRMIKGILLFISELYGRYIKPVHILDSSSTIDFVKENRACVSRFGDGEFNICIYGESIVFQKYTPALSQKLLHILQSSRNNLLICIPEAINTREGFTEKAAQFWNGYLSRRKIGILKKLSKNRVYGNTNFTRPYMDLENKENSKIYFEKILNLFEGQDLLVVEGEFTRSGIGNDLFSKANSVQRIICPSTNAYSCIDKILDAVQICGKNKLILISLGPTATVLAYELANDKNEDYWAIDLGHLDVEYEWYKNAAMEKIGVQGKFVAEAGGNFQQELNDSVLTEYYEQIVKIIK